MYASADGLNSGAGALAKKTLLSFDEWLRFVKDCRLIDAEFTIRRAMRLCPMPLGPCLAPKPNAQCPMPLALALPLNPMPLMPIAQCPMPNAQCPMPNN